MVENERSSFSSGSQTNSFSSNESLRFFHDENQETSDENLLHRKETGNSEDAISEKLSTVTEHHEDSLLDAKDPETPEDQTDEESKRVMEGRIKTLREMMSQLKDQLRTEVALWRKERAEVEFLRERSDMLALEEANAAARAAAIAYAAESALSSELGDVADITSEQALKELTILEYEKELAKYQDALAFAQAEKRYNARRRMIARAYERRVAEVEKLCNEELEKIRENASHLRPLKEMASRWCARERSNGDSGDKIVGNDFHEFCDKIDAEVNMAAEIFTARFNFDDALKRQAV